MATLSSAQEKLARNTGPGSKGERNWNAAKPRMNQNYASGMARFFGGPINAGIVQNHAAGIAGATYRGPDAAKWAANFRAKMVG